MDEDPVGDPVDPNSSTDKDYIEDIARTVSVSVDGPPLPLAQNSSNQSIHASNQSIIATLRPCTSQLSAHSTPTSKGSPGLLNSSKNGESMDISSLQRSGTYAGPKTSRQSTSPRRGGTAIHSRSFTSGEWNRDKPAPMFAEIAPEGLPVAVTEQPMNMLSKPGSFTQSGAGFAANIINSIPGHRPTRSEVDAPSMDLPSPNEELPCAPLNIEETFAHMQIRKMNRRRGYISAHSTWDTLWFILLLTLFLGYGVVTYSYTGQYNIQFTFGNPVTSLNAWGIVFMIVTFWALFLVEKLRKFTKYCLLSWGLFVLIYLLMIEQQPLAAIALLGNVCGNTATKDLTLCPPETPCRSILRESGYKKGGGSTYKCLPSESGALRVAIMVLFFIFELLCLLKYLWSQVIYNYLVRNGKLSPQGWWHLGRVTARPNTFTFHCRLEFPHIVGKKRFCQYNGEVDVQRRPHGWGHWMDDSRQGESLWGFWENGKPTGPFVSRESQSGYAFSSVRIGFVMARNETWEESRFIPRHGALQVGVAAVECSTSGKFFVRFPATQCVVGPMPIEAANDAECPWASYLLSEMHHVNQNEEPTNLVVSVDPEGFHITGHFNDNYPEAVTIRRKIIEAPERSLDSSMRDRIRSNIHIVEVDGWEQNKNAEFEALLFIPGYNTSLKQTLDRFAQLLCLGDFPSHIKPFVYSYPAGQIFSYFQAKGCAQAEETGDALLQTMQGLYQAGCRTIHVMAHSMGATAFLTHVVRMSSVWMPTHDNIRSIDAIPSGMNLSTVTLLNPDFPRDQFLSPVFEQLRHFCSRITMYADENDGALEWSERLNRTGRFLGHGTPSVGRAVFSMCHTVQADTSLSNMSAEESSKQYLDMDVVDTTWIENNVQNIRHNFFNINREVIEDLRELVLTKKRARQRARLVHRIGNVYSFLAAPSCVVNP